jgi:hypothetical protein
MRYNKLKTSKKNSKVLIQQTLNYLNKNNSWNIKAR